MLIRGFSGRCDDRRGLRLSYGKAGGAVVAALACAAATVPAWPAAAEQYRIGGHPVVVDYGVLDSLGPPVPEATSVPPVPTIRRVLPPGYGPTVQLRPPPSKPPQSTLTAEQPPEETAPEPSQAADLSATIDELTGTETASETTPTPPPPPSEIEPPPAPAMPESESVAPAEEIAESETGTDSGMAAASEEPTASETESTEFAPPVDEGMESGAESAAESPPAAEAQPPEPDTTAEAPSAEAATSETPPAAEAAPAAEEGAQTAALPPAATVEGQLRIEFPEGSAEIPESARQSLDGLASQLNSDQAMRVQLLAYASGSADAASRARRMSLSRALAVRAYLIAQGVRSTRMDVRALGNNVEGEPADRVDIIPQAQ